MADSAVQEPGWYVDDIGLEVTGSKPKALSSPLVSTHDLGYGFIDADIILPNNTV